MKLNFRMDWGYQYLYSRRIQHPFYLWDGRLDCRGGTILECYKLNYPVLWFGPGHCAHEEPLAKPEWKSRTKRGLAGVRVVAEVGEGADFTLHTASGDFDFSAADIIEKGRLRFPVGPKYLGCAVIVTKDRHLWFRPDPQPGELAWEADDLAALLPVRDWARMRTAWLEPGGEVKLQTEIPATSADFSETIFHLVAMTAPGFTPGQERQARGLIALELLCDGKPVAEFSHIFREHDTYMQLLEDVWTRFKASPGRHELTLRNCASELPLLISRITLRQACHNHLDLSLQEWALVGEPLLGRVFAVREDECAVRFDGKEEHVHLQPGWNEFPFSFATAGERMRVDARAAGSTSSANIQIYNCAEERIPLTVGYDMTVVPHDSTGFMDWLLDYTWRTRLGNLVVFRPFNKPQEAEWRRWGEFCRDHRIVVEATELNKTLAESSGPLLHSMGRHEWPGAVYAFDPRAPYASNDMKTAREHYIAYLKTEVDKAHAVSPRAAFGDASGGHRYCYLAGADFIRSETMVPHTQHLCSQARPAAEVFKEGEWGVHIAIQHCYQPYDETHLGQFFLSLHQPWMMGANMLYEEDSLFLLFKEERQTWDDALTKGKRALLRDFLRFAKTHPRQGVCRRNIAFLEGRYAAPFNGFICDSEQTPDYSVWGLFGNAAPEWGHRQPEKCRQLLDVLMPGASTLPLNQRFDKRRFFFSGTPFGDFDETPIEASASYLSRYKLLLNLGWNTMLQEDWDKLSEYVRQGGVLLTGIPQFSKHVRRDFLADLRDLALWNSGDLSDLCGLRVLGPGTPYSGQWNAKDRETFFEPVLSSLPNHTAEEDGAALCASVELEGAEVVAYDAASGAPMLVKRQVGRGCVYTFTLWAYPGHERFQGFCATWLARLAAQAQPEIRVEDPSGEVFWTLWDKAGGHTLMLLNTDWTCKGNVKTVEIVTPSRRFSQDVPERKPVLIEL